MDGKSFSFRGRALNSFQWIVSSLRLSRLLFSDGIQGRNRFRSSSSFLLPRVVAAWIRSHFRVALSASFPKGLLKWLKLLLHQWSNTRRWFSFGGIVDETSWTMATGIPQGNSASPLLLAFYLWQGFNDVETALRRSQADFAQGIYMDDRTIIASRPDAVETIRPQKKATGEC